MDKTISFRGYTKKENDHWVAVCIDLNVVAQGKTADEAEATCYELIFDYLNFVGAKYPDRITEYVPRLAPKELIEEYDEIVGRSLLKKRPPRGRKLRPYIVQPSQLSFC